MADMIYRGVRYDPAKSQTSVARSSKPMIYRGVAYSREDIKQTPRKHVEICFRGVRFRKHPGRDDFERLPVPE